MPDFTDIIEVDETNSVDEANKKLKEGWILIDSYNYVSDEYLKDDLTHVYVLGKRSI